MEPCSCEKSGEAVDDFTKARLAERIKALPTDRKDAFIGWIEAEQATDDE